MELSLQKLTNEIQGNTFQLSKTLKDFSQFYDEALYPATDESQLLPLSYF